MTQGKENTKQEIPAEEIHISVRRLVEFILRHGDIDQRHQGGAENAMQEGGRIHRMIQRRMGAEYQAEVPLKYTIPADGYLLTVEGRADGIIHQKGQVVIDEIKGTYRELAKMRGPAPLHLAQAKCYACMYGISEQLTEVRVRLTYCNMVSEELRYFYEDYTISDLREWFAGVVSAYRKWADYSWKWHSIRQSSIQGLAFPFPYREGQRELVVNVYRTIYHKKKLFLEAPTGVGKTLSTIYPALQALGKGMGEKLFYLTAKSITRTVAEDALEILRNRGLRLKSVILTAKEKICFMDQADCNPEYCPYARGHYDRINDAVFELLTSQESFSREKIEEYAVKHQVCPFEMCLDMSLFSDAVICDYNYLFDPHIYLKRFFGEASEGKHSSENYLFLIDEAHNLLERGREMYSAVLWKEQFVELRRELKQTIASENYDKNIGTDIQGQLSIECSSLRETVESSPSDKGKMTQDLTTMSEEMEDENLKSDSEVSKRHTGHHGGRSTLVRQGYGDQLVHQLKRCNEEMLLLKRECEGYCLVESIETFVQNLMRLHAVMDEYLSEQEEVQLPVRELLLEFYFDVSHFLAIYELMDDNYVRYTQLGEDGSFLLKLFCVNPRENLKSCLVRGRSTILFSATFLPIQYYKKLLGGEQEDYEVYAQSVFDPARRLLVIASDVTSKYTRRSQEEYDKITRYIEEIVKNRPGNYMVFCPSYAFLHIIYDSYVDNFAGKEMEDRECVIQNEVMSEAEREAFLSRFQSCASGNTVLIGFCVLGGIFSEGIDLKKDSLIGAIIVGTGLPQVCDEREILKRYFDENGENGFDYAYRYPGMNKVLQAAGRVIRTVEDVGVIALLDERFLQYSYRKLFPREWESFEAVSVDKIAERVERFWDKWHASALIHPVNGRKRP